MATLAKIRRTYNHRLSPSYRPLMVILAMIRRSYDHRLFDVIPCADGHTREDQEDVQSPSLRRRPSHMLAKMKQSSGHLILAAGQATSPAFLEAGTTKALVSLTTPARSYKPLINSSEILMTPRSSYESITLEPADGTAMCY